MDIFEIPDRLWLWAAALSYTVAFALAVSSIARRQHHSRTMLFALVAFGFVLQTTGLYQRGAVIGSCPLGNKFEIVQFLVWSATVLFLIVGPAFRLSLLGFFTSGLVTILALVSLAIPGWDSIHRSSLFSNNPWIELHAAIGMFSYGAFGLLAITSAMFIIQNYGLKKKKHFPGFLRLLPSIVALEQIKLRLLLLGLALLSLSLGIGYFYFLRNPDAVNSMKFAATGLVWIAYMIVLLLHQVRVLRSNLLAWTTIVLFGLVLLTLEPVSKSRSEPATATDLFSK
jgi:HemX protein